jgi:hypothetical protein
MPYEVSFKKRVPSLDREKYLNYSCVGGDVVAERLLPSVRSRYTHIQTSQKTWGWFIGFRSGAVRLAIVIHADDPQAGTFRVRLTSRVRRLFLFDSVVDTGELDALRTLVISELRAWAGENVSVMRVDRDYN